MFESKTTFTESLQEFMLHWKLACPAFMFQKFFTPHIYQNRLGLYGYVQRVKSNILEDFPELQTNSSTPDVDTGSYLAIYVLDPNNRIVVDTAYIAFVSKGEKENYTYTKNKKFVTFLTPDFIPKRIALNVPYDNKKGLTEHPLPENVNDIRQFPNKGYMYIHTYSRIVDGNALYQIAYSHINEQNKLIILQKEVSGELNPAKKDT